jgi:hypothetical protein
MTIFELTVLGFGLGVQYDAGDGGVGYNRFRFWVGCSAWVGPFTFVASTPFLRHQNGV